MFNVLNKLKSKRGFTLMEILVVVGIIAIIAVISVTGILTIRDNLAFRQKNDYAKSIFMAAQTHLTELRASNGLEKLEKDADYVLDAYMDDLDNPDTEKIEYEDYYFTYNGHAAYNIVLPVGSVESLIREQDVIIEYNPKTGNVYSVFYSEDYPALVVRYKEGVLPRNAEGDEEKRKDMMLGYYDGSDLSGEELGLMEVKADITFDNGEEGLVTVIVPTQDDTGFSIAEDGNYNRYMNGLTVRLTIVGEMGGVINNIELTSAESCPYKHERSVEIGEGGKNEIHITFPIDSLYDGRSFADLAETTDSIGNTSFIIRPGDNVSITAEVTYASSATDPIVEIEDAIIAGVNPMFASLTPGSAADKYILTVSNGRNLQNLNALSPTIAAMVESVLFVQDDDETENLIDWNDTVEYYNEKYGSGGVYTNTAAEAPARALPYFVPIMNGDLLNGSAKIIGNGVKIYDLTIDNSGKTDATYANTGLFATANTSIDGINIVNPVIRGRVPVNNSTGESAATRANGDFATGALVGRMGTNASVTNCGVYIDTEDIDFVRSNLNMKDFDGYDGDGSEKTSNAQYGVSGSGAVGGLIGNSQSTQTVETSFAAVPVYGANTSGNGVGGLVGLSSGTSYQKCYASGTVGASICSSTYGAGGFVGTSNNSTYTNCFATGDVNASDNSTGGCAGFVGVLDSNSTLKYCYSAGLANLKEDFCGYFAGTKNDEFKKKNYYLNQVEASNGDTSSTLNTVSEKLAVAVTYEQLVDLLTDTNDTNLNYKYDTVSPDHWGLTKVQNNPQYYILSTHPYDISLGNSAYPFTMLKDSSTGKLMDYYGNWPRKPLDVGIAYYEIYSTNDDEYFGFYFDRDVTSTLRDNADVISDGYMILSATQNTAFGTLGINIPIEEKDDFITIQIGDKPYYVYPVTSSTLSNNNNFYTKLEYTANNNTYTFYYNPNVALSHINPADGSTTATAPSTVPSTIYIRTARQLAAVGKNMSNFWGKNYIQQLDIDFTKYTGTIPAITPIGNSNSTTSTTTFTGSYIGRKDNGEVPKIIGYAPANAVDSGIFGVIGETGVVRNLSIETGASEITGGGTGTTNIGLLAGQNTGTIENVDLTLKGTVELNAKDYAGLLVGVNSGDLIDCHVVQSGGTATLNASCAGGLVGSVTGGTVENSSVKLNSLKSDYEATNSILAGVLGNVNSGVSISDIPFQFTGTNAAITSEGKAAGFVGTTSGNLTNCSVRGKGSISGTTSAAGFAVTVSGGTIDGCVVSPAENNEDYKNNSNGNLTITANTAAGFAVTNNALTTQEKNDSIRNSMALGTVKGTTNAAGFVVTNAGTIEYCMSNVDMEKGTVFAKTNSGTVKECYGWASDGATLDSNSGETIHYTSSYFGLMDSDKNVVLFDFKGTPSNYPTATLSQSSALNRLTGGSGKSVWVKDDPKSDTIAEYPYKNDLVKYNYPYPMLREHYGDWPIPSDAYEYGVVYYEKYSSETGDSWGVHLINMSEADSSVSNSNSLSPTANTTVLDAGYALFCKIGATPFCNETNAMIGTLLTDAKLYTAAGLDSAIYGLYSLKFSVPNNSTDGQTSFEPEITVENINRTVSIDLIPLFADTLENTRDPYRVRTQAHLENISLMNSSDFIIDRCFSVDENFTTIGSFSGTLTGEEGAKVTATELSSGLINQLDGGTIDNVELSASIIARPKAESGMTLGTLANVATDGTITNCVITTEINVSTNTSTSSAVSETTETTSSGTESGSGDSSATTNHPLVIGGIVGQMQGGSLEKCEVRGSIATTDTAIEERFTCTIGGAVGIADASSLDKFGTYLNVQTTVAIDTKFAQTGSNTSNPNTGLYISSHGRIGEFVGFVEGGAFTDCSASDKDHPYQFFGGIQAASRNVDNITHYRNATDNEMIQVEDGNGTSVMVYHFDHAAFENCTGDTALPKFEAEKYFYNNGANVTPKYERSEDAISATAVEQSVSSDALKSAAEQNDGKSNYFICDDKNGTYYRVTVHYKEAVEGNAETGTAAAPAEFIFTYTDEAGNACEKTWVPSENENTCDFLYTLAVNLSTEKQYMVLTADGDYALLWSDTGVTFQSAPNDLSANSSMICTADGSKMKGPGAYSATIQIPDTYSADIGLELIGSNNIQVSIEGRNRFLIFEAHQVADAISYKCVFTQTNTQT